MGRIPGILMFAAVLSIIFGGLGLICNPLAVIGGLLSGGEEIPTLPGLPAINMSPMARIASVVGDFVDIFTSAAVLACGIGSFGLKSWVRPVMNATAVMMIVNKTITHLLYSWAMSPELIRFAGEINPMGANTAASGVGVVIGALCMLPILLAYPTAMLIIYNLSSVRRAFEMGGLPPGGGGGYGYPEAYPPPTPYPQYPQGPYGGPIGPPPPGGEGGLGAPPPPGQGPPQDWYGGGRQ